MQEHLIEACPKMKGSCVNCKLEMIRSDLDNHLCKLQSPEQTITAQAAVIEGLKEENASKTDEINQYVHTLTEQQVKLD